MKLSDKQIRGILTLLEGDVADWSLVALRKTCCSFRRRNLLISLFSWGLDHVNRMAMNKVIKNDIVCVLDCSELVPLGFVLDQLKFFFAGCSVLDSAQIFRCSNMLWILVGVFHERKGGHRFGHAAASILWSKSDCPRRRESYAGENGWWWGN